MELADGTVADDRRVGPTIPTAGIEEVRRAWSGRGGLWAAVSSARDDHGEVWTAQLARRRAARVAIELIRPALESWPRTRRAWVDALPAQSVRHRTVDDSPGTGVDWAQTRRGGWPPREFHHRRKSRVADTLLATATRWTIEQMTDVAETARALDPGLLGEAAEQRLIVASEMLTAEPLCSSNPIEPTIGDLVALRSSGRPWTSVASAASWLKRLLRDPAALAGLPIDPDPELSERLFHVASFGCLLRGLRERGWERTFLRLPGDGGGGPVMKLTAPDGQGWDMWFEMAGAWTYYGVTAPYPPAVAGIAGTGGPLGGDLALVRPGEQVVIVECKYSANPTYVGRNGYEQVLAYMAEALTGLAHSAAGVVVGPQEVVRLTGRTNTSVGPIAVTSPEHAAAQIAEWCTGARAVLT